MLRLRTSRLNPEIINAAIVGFEAQKRRIDEQIADLRRMLNSGAKNGGALPTPAKKRKRRLSTAGRKAIVEALRKRWAAARRGEDKGRAGTLNACAQERVFQSV